MTVADVITAISVAISAIAFVVGVNTWKREFVGKRRLELAETLLALFYEAEDAIREIRNPISFGGEGSTRTRSEHEAEEEARLLDQAFVAFERYQKREKLFAELRSMKYRAMATFGSNANEPFEEIGRVLNEIFASAHILGTHFWRRQGRVAMTDEEFQKHLADVHKFEAVFWYMGADEDKIGERVSQAVQFMETITKEAALVKAKPIKLKKKRFWKSGKST